MLARFCLYGFLKNQRYFEPFLALYLLSRGLSFFEIGVLIAAREVTTNLLEVVSGAAADVWGRRRTLIGAWCVYIASFAALAMADAMAGFAAGMVLFGVGEAFRSGTHKAMIFAWLRQQGREKERTAIYGLTRSWSKLGSAASVVVAAGFVLVSDDLRGLLWASMAPCVFGVINFLGYPASLDGERGGGRGPREIVRLLLETLRGCARSPGLRGLIAGSMGFEGIFTSTKDYIQPVLKAAAIAALAGVWGQGLGEHQQAALLIGPVFFGVYLMSAVASRRASALVARAGSEARASRWLWGGLLGCFGLLTPALVLGWSWAVIGCFVLLNVLHDAWRPIQVGRFDDHCDEQQQATVLSIESQASSLATMIAAPLLGAAVDVVSARQGGEALWPVGVFGLLVALAFVAVEARGARREGSSAR